MAENKWVNWGNWGYFTPFMRIVGAHLRMNLEMTRWFLSTSPGANSSPNNDQVSATLTDCQWMLAERSAGSDATKVPLEAFGRSKKKTVRETFLL